MFMHPPISQTFHEGPIAKDLLLTLKRINKTIHDVQYVSYSVAEPNYGKWNKYHCNIHEFLSATNIGTSIFDLKWPYEIAVVGSGFWIDYDFRGVWNAHILPERPSTYRAPSKNDLLKDNI